MPALIIIGCIILFFVFLFTVHAYITIEMTDDVALTVRVLGIPIRILPKKPKTYNTKNYTLKKIRKRDAKAAAKAAKKAEAKKKKQAEKEQKTVMLGYANMDEKELVEATQILCRIWK